MSSQTSSVAKRNISTPNAKESDKDFLSDQAYELTIPCNTKDFKYPYIPLSYKKIALKDGLLVEVSS
ncbi:hypothetical protein O6P43_009705 [Quillaja saponaria]|uniref:Uncharacterized protein n=1 Tax=Quillaja saponaria TaxID=32244 RepID=A0AAD7PYW3_QUISA|nr:hypothetical protein O6P43_009705 [Quillaja saponaria]